MKKLDHPNIMCIYELAKDDKYYYIISELCDGTELFNEIHRKLREKEVFTEEQVRIIFKQILSAIGYAHNKNIIHRDIKPENILIDSDLHIKIIDWGLSKDMTDISFLKQKIGTVDYAAPEVLLSKAYDSKCDLWSCGVILYILLSGESPFPGQNTGEIEQMIISSKINMKQKIWKSVSKNAKDLLKKLLESDPNKRISAQDALNHPFIQEQQKTVINSQELQYRLEKLARFCCSSKLVQATFHLIIQQNLNQNKLKKIRATFEQLDANGDGKLSLEELKAHYDKDDIEELFHRVDTDQNGYIEFTEFIAASLDMRKLASYDQLKQAFSTVDENNDGFLEIDEIKRIFQGKIQVTDEQQWDQLLVELDSDHDGKVSFEEYYEIIKIFIDQTMPSNLGSQEPGEPQIQKKVKIERKYNTRNNQQK